MSQSAALNTSLTLLHRIEAQDPQAWQLFTQLYGPLVYSWCRSMGLQPDDVEDVGQEVFRVVAARLATFQLGGSRPAPFDRGCGESPGLRPRTISVPRVNNRRPEVVQITSYACNDLPSR